MPLQTKEAANAGPVSRKSRLRKFLVRTGKVLVAVYFGVLAVLAFYQTHLVLPGGFNHAAGQDQVLPSNGAVIVPRLDPGDARILGLFEPALGADHKAIVDVASRPTVLYFYGNGSCVRDTVDTVDRFRKDGVNVFVAEYDGYGMNTGAPSEKACYRTADLAYAYLTHDLHVDPSHLVIAGWSLGSSVAIDLASRSKSAGLVVISPFNNMAELASRGYPMYPAWLMRLVLRYPFASDQKIDRVKCPIMDVHSRTDEVVPFYMSAKLMSRAKSPVTRVVIERARHGDFFHVGGHIDRQVVDFVHRSTTQSPPPVKRTIVLPKP